MNPITENGIAFVRIDNKMINLRFVRKIELSGNSLIFTVPEGDSETDHYLHEGSDQVFAALTHFCVN